MPVEDVELDGSHAVERALDDIDRLEMAADVDQEAAPAKAGRILNGDGGKEVDGAVGLHELQKGFEAAHCADVGRGFELRAGGGYVERVGFIFIDRLDGFTGTVDGDGESCGA